MGSCDTRIATGGIQYQRALNIPLAMSSIMSLCVVNDQRFEFFDPKRFDRQRTDVGSSCALLQTSRRISAPKAY